MRVDRLLRTILVAGAATVAALVSVLALPLPLHTQEAQGPPQGAPADSVAELPHEPTATVVVEPVAAPEETVPEGPPALPDTTAGVRADPGAAAATVSDSLGSTVWADSLVYQPAFPDTFIGPPTVTYTTALGPELPPIDPYAIGVSLPHAMPPYVRPWDLARIRGKRGFDVVAPEVIVSPITGTPFTRELVVDRERDTVMLVTRVGDSFSRVSYAAPLSEFVRQGGGQRVEAKWVTASQYELGKGAATGPGGLLDIDIPMPLGAGANLKVRGSERITFGGQTSYIVEALDSEGGAPSRFPQLDMEQQLTVNLEGTIGNKIHVYVDHRSGGDTFGTGKANEIRVHYEGAEDEIIQRIELGEVNLSLPGTEFVSYSGHAQGLFGAKMLAKLGKLDVTAIASKEEGKTSGASFTGTSQADSLVIRDIQYKGGTFFAIDSPSLKYSDRAVEQLTVYVDDLNGSNDVETGAQPGVAYLVEEDGAIDPADTTAVKQVGRFDELVELEDYLFDNQTGVIEFLFPISDGHVMAVRYDRFDPYSVGGSDGDTLRLKMIKKDGRVVGSPWEPTRRFELKHVYDLGADNIPEEGFALIIRKKSASGEDPDVENGVPYVEILGLDTAGTGGDPVPDGAVDPQWLDLEKGYVYYPYFTPYCPGWDTTGFYYDPGNPPPPEYVAEELEEYNCAVYDNEVFQAGDDLYYMVVKYSRPQTTFYLGQINIIENSEVVRLNGVPLTRGTDYTIYYPAGQLTLLNEEAKEPDAKVTVEFDYKPFGISGEKTLLGGRGVYRWSDNVELGTTWMYQSKGTPDDRPRLGEEPTRNVVGDVNLSADFAPYWMTAAADAVPFVNTDALSRLRIAGEAAMSMPEPNTKGFVTIDDMEGVDQTSMLGVQRRLWSFGSAPEELGVDVADRMNIDWYNPDRTVREGDLHPDLPTSEANETHTVLEIDYDAANSASWAGLMRLLSKTGNDYSRDTYFEMWINDDGHRHGKIHMDLGTISEDYYPLDASVGPNGELDSEDIDVPPNGYDADEDRGLDNVWGVDGDNVPGDDGDDDYEFSFGSNDYSRINGTEGNERFDTEDLNGNLYLDTENRYWELTIDLSDTTYLMRDNSDPAEVPDEDKRSDWRLYRIPLSHATSIGGVLDWTVIKSARIWVEDLTVGAVPLMIGSLDIKGNTWERQAVRDEDGNPVDEEDLPPDLEFIVGAVNTKEDPAYANDPPFPPGIDSDTNLPEREQSLALNYLNLPGEWNVSAKNAFFSEENYTSYETLEFYVHGDDDVADGTRFFLRHGADSLNFYEYSLELREGWRQNLGSSQNRLKIAFDSFTDLKLDPYENDITAAAWGDTARVKGELFRRVGWPSLSRISTLSLGVRNDSEDLVGNEISGSVWIDELVLTDVRKDIGWAERVTINSKFADLAVIDFDFRHVDQNFHTLKQTRGSGSDNLIYNITGTVNSGKFIGGLGVSAPLNFTWKKTQSRPQFSSGSDIVLDAEESVEHDPRQDRLQVPAREITTSALQQHRPVPEAHELSIPR